MNQSVRLYYLDGTNVHQATNQAEVLRSRPQLILSNTYEGHMLRTVFAGRSLLRAGLQVGPPLVFETRIIGGIYAGYSQATANYQDAVDMHRSVLASLMAHGAPPPPYNVRSAPTVETPVIIETKTMPAPDINKRRLRMGRVHASIDTTAQAGSMGGKRRRWQPKE